MGNVGEERAERDDQLDAEVPCDADDDICERAPAEVGLDTEEQYRVTVDSGHGGAIEGVLGPFDPAGQPFLEA